MTDVTIEADVCIIGSGVAGLLVAGGLAGEGLNIVVVEQGRRESYDDHLKAGSEAPLYPPPRVVSRGSRPFAFDGASTAGGSTLVWGGVAVRLHPNDFRMRSLYGRAVDWPIGYEDVEPYYCRAETELGVGGAPSRTWPRSRPFPGLPFSPSPVDRLMEGVFGEEFVGLPLAKAGSGEGPSCSGFGLCRLCPTGAKYTALGVHLPRLAANKDVSILEGIWADRLAWTAGGRADALICRREDGGSVVIRAGRYVAAANGIESPALLLRSGYVDPSGCLGRNFIDHPYLFAAFTTRADIPPWHGDTLSTGGLTSYLDGDFRKDSAAAFVTVNNTGARAVEFFIDRALKGGMSGPTMRQAAVKDYRGHFSVSILLETLPHGDNRIAVDGRSWTMDLQDFDDYTRSGGRKALAAFTARLGSVGAEEMFSVLIPSAHHYLGTCRMGATAADGAVDRHQRLWAAENVFIAGGAVFPTGGACHPTLTIAALSCRLGDHLLGRN